MNKSIRFRKHLIYVRKKLNLTHAEMADMLNVHRTSVVRWEKGHLPKENDDLHIMMQTLDYALKRGKIN